MYEECVSLELSKGERSVLDRLSFNASKSVAAQVLEDLSRQLSSVVNGTAVSLVLNQDDVKWFMEVVCYSLSLSFTSDYPTVRNAVRLYCDWLSCASKEPNPSVPVPLLEQPLFYASKIINHFHHLFLPRSDSLNTDVILRQAKECHHVLRCIQTVMFQAKEDLKAELWPIVLQFLLSVNDALLALPFEPDDISDQLCDRVLDVLFELWFSASATGYFPSPSYWKTFRALCARWRHRVQLIDHWVRASLALTARQLCCLYGDDYCKMTISEEDKKLVPKDMSAPLIAQTWYRVLHLIEDPIKFLSSSVKQSLDQLTSRSIKSLVVGGELGHGSTSSSSDYPDFPFFVHWQYSFYRMMRGVYCIISGFLGDSIDCNFREPDKALKELNSLLNQTLTLQANNVPQVNPSVALASSSQTISLFRVALNLGASGSTKSKGSKIIMPSKTTVSLNQLSDSVIISAILKALPLTRPKLSAYSNKCPSMESLCKLFGDWLFPVASFKTDFDKKLTNFEDSLSQKSGGSQQSSDAETPMKSTPPSNLTMQQSEVKTFLESLPSVSGFQAGKAETLAALCKIFASKDCKENLSGYILSRFYSVIHDALIENDTIVTSYVIFHSVNLFRVELMGVELLIPYFLDCLDALCIEPDKTRIHPSLTDTEVRLACMHVLSSVICVPAYYGNKTFNDINSNRCEQFTFIGLRSKILRVLLHEMKIETDSQNLQICICLFSVFCQSSWLWEEENEEDLGQKSPSEQSHYFAEVIRLVLPTICDSLCGKWSSDYGVCLAAIDCFCLLINFMADNIKTYLSNIEDVVLHLCRFIDVQLSKPPPAHSRDLHSTIVGAFYCLETLLVSAPKLLRSEICLQKVTQVIQLGLTGVKAESPVSNELDHGDKKSASQRVHDAAEQLLYTLFSRVGEPFVIGCAPEDELFLFQTLQSDKLRFSYYYAENTCIFALADEFSKKDLPTTVLLLRSPFNSASSWTFSFRNTENEKDSTPPIYPHPEGENRPKLNYPSSNFFPVEVEKVDKCKIDYSLPNDCELTPELNKMKNTLKNLAASTTKCSNRRGNNLRESTYEKCDTKPDGYDHRVNASRLFLQSLGYLDYDSNGLKCQLLRSEDVDFGGELKNLDSCPSRSVHTVHIFYVKTGKTSAVDILQNGLELDQSPLTFRTFLSNLGTGINVQNACLWTGHWSTAYYNGADAFEYSNTPQNGGSFILDGISHALYWATPLLELAFLVPTIRSYKLANRSRVRSSPREISRTQDDNCGYGDIFKSTLPSPVITTATTCEQQNNLLHVCKPSGVGTINGSGQQYFRHSADCYDLKQKSARFNTVINFYQYKQHGNYISNSQSKYERLENDDNDSCFLETTTKAASPRTTNAGATGDFVGMAPVPPPRSKSLSQDAESLSTMSRTPFTTSISGSSLKKRSSLYQDYRILFVWLETYDDLHDFPLEELLVTTDLGEDNTTLKNDSASVIFIWPMKNGLFKIKLSMFTGRTGYFHPLVDGEIVSFDILSSTVRQMALSIAMRRRLENEGYCPPFVRRRQKIQELGCKFAKNYSYSDLICEVLTR